uniref:Putative athila transposon protein n=1 Tax=Tanacetum cinerariifolium TaxID=118510 RepID=A0A6L2K2H3_TANCI|nr:putative athila transposon protein [Tanacetum cinerariifolium]
MADNRTMTELLRAPTEGYAEAIVVPSILAEQFELTHSLINMMTIDQFFGLEKDNPHDHILNQQTSVVTTAMTAMTPPLAPVKVVEETYVTCGGAHPYYQCLAAGGNTFPEFRDNIQGYVSAAAVNYNQGNLDYRPQSVANQIRPPVANPKSDLKAITTRSGVTYDGPQIPPLVVENEPKATKDTVNPTNNETTKDVQPQVVQSKARMAKCLALADLGASINLMPYSVWKKLSLLDLTPTCMTLELADRLISRPVGVAEDVYVKVSPVHCVPKRGGFIVVENEDNELIPTRLVMGWRFCIDYRKLNEATRKDHSPLPFMDQMLKRLAGNQYYCFLDGFSGYFQIPIDPKDQEKTTFTCPYGTFAYRRMPFGLCNAPGTFQRCMIAIFHDMIEKTMEVFMNDFSVLGNSFQSCLSHLEKMLKRCKDTNLCPNWEKSQGRNILGQRQDKHFRPIYYASKTMTEAESKYTTTKKEMLAVLYAFYKFRSYLILNKSIVYTDHSALKYLFAKKDSKAQLLRWVLLLQEFTFKVVDTKGAENMAADHLSRLENPHQNVLDPKEINESFPLETLNLVSTRGDPRGVYLVRKPLISSRLATLDLPKTAGDNRKIQIKELNELRDQAYANSLIYKEKTKRIHDSKIRNRVFNVGDRVLLFNSRLKIFSGKLKSRWSGPFTISYVFPYGIVELSQPDGPNFKVNGHRLKHYFGEDIP